MNRCAWAETGGDLYHRYHDKEWGVPLHDDRKLYEFLVLDAAQAGLSWQTVLLKQENYRKAFDGFDHERIARYTEKRVSKLLANPGIIRNRLKVESAITPPWRGAPFPQDAGRVRLVGLTERYVESLRLQSDMPQQRKTPSDFLIGWLYPCD